MNLAVLSHAHLTDDTYICFSEVSRGRGSNWGAVNVLLGAIIAAVVLWMNLTTTKHDHLTGGRVCVFLGPDMPGFLT